MSASFSGGDEHSEPENAIPALSSGGEPSDTGTGPEAASGAAAAVSALPCLKSDNCIENDKTATGSLSPYRKKSRHRLIMAIEWMVKKYGLNYVGLLTLSFGVPGSGRGSQATRELREQAKDLEFVQNRWHSFNTNVVAKRYSDWICVLELHEDGVWHFHVVVTTKEDIRTGTDVETLSNYRLPYWMRRGKHLRNEALAKEWRELRQVCCKYRFGRVELLPIKKTGAALARYLAGYLSKAYRVIPFAKRQKPSGPEMKRSRRVIPHWYEIGKNVDEVVEEDCRPRHRLVRYSRGLSRCFSMRFSVNDLGNLIYRTKLKMAAGMLHFDDYGDFAGYLGRRWNYYLGDLIAAIPMPMRFGKGDFKRGIAAKILNDYAENPEAYLSPGEAKELAEVETALLRKFTDLAFDDDVEGRLERSSLCSGDNVGDGPVTVADLQGELLGGSEHPF